MHFEQQVSLFANKCLWNNKNVDNVVAEVGYAFFAMKKLILKRKSDSRKYFSPKQKLNIFLQP